jgi:glutamate-ammonia-ligase adenylyltransferase
VDRSGVLQAISEGSPYLSGLAARFPGIVDAVRVGRHRETFDALCSEARAASRLASLLDVSVALRQIKAKGALLIALVDLDSGDFNTVADSLTRFADTLLGAAVDWLLRDAARRGKLNLVHDNQPSRGCGYTVLAMGKHGAHELNYSSDIDLIVLFDADEAPVAAGVEPATFFVRMTKQLVTLLQDVTEHGYVYRVDLRLRPDPRATQVAIAIESAAVYYESMGQNWERAAMIKARPAAGDLALGEEFLKRLAPYIWRKYLDFAAIADVQSLKRQIHAVKGHGDIAVVGHNVKLGRGGIREIEFFVQTQQLIAGGRNPKLRGRQTLQMLDALAEERWISLEAAGELKDAYRFLRTVEHRIQMVNDEQSHTLPADTEGFARLARFAGFASADEFTERLLSMFRTVQGHYSRLFEDAPELGTGEGSLVFTGGEDDPETIETLQNLGFAQASEVSATIRGWHFGRYNATRSARSKELLTELMPALLTALARAGEADRAFLAFDKFLGGLPAGVQFFSMVKANPRLLDLIATVLATAPRLAEQLSRRPQILDAVIDPNFFGALPDRAEIRRQVDFTVPAQLPLDEAVDRCRVVGRELAFRIGVRIISETVSAVEAGTAFSELASVLIARLLAAVAGEVADKHGTIAGARCAVMALGKLGGGEMTAGSDLDLIVVYDAPDANAMSDGPRAVSVNQYFTRLTQRLVAALSTPTAEGVLYDVDLRLRPSGNKGPVATSLASFKAYHRDSAWTWERLALTRARVIAGDPTLASDIEQVISKTLSAPRDMEQACADVLDMRRLILKEHGEGGVWDIKRVFGGLVDVEFAAQFLQLRYPRVRDQNTIAALTKLGEAGHLKPEVAHDLRRAAELYHRLTQVLRLCVSGAYDPKTAPLGLNRLVANAAEAPDLAHAEALLAETQAWVCGHFCEIVGDPRTSSSP